MAEDKPNEDFKPFSYQTFRGVVVPPADWKFGYDGQGKAKTRIIVKFKDNKDQEWIRQYDKECDATYFCVGCLQNKRIKNIAQLKDNNQFWAPSFHDCQKICPKKNAADQKENEQKYLLAQSKVAPSTPISKRDEQFVNLNKKKTSTSLPINIPQETPMKVKKPIDAARKPPLNESRTTSPIIISSTSSTPTSNSGKTKITNFFAQKESLSRSQTPQGIPMKQNTAETPTQFKRQISKNIEKENQRRNANSPTVTTVPSSESNNCNTKRSSLTDGVVLVEEEEPEPEMNFEHMDFDDHPENFNTPQFSQVQQESTASANVENVKSSEAANNEDQEDAAVINTTEKMQRTKKTMLEFDITLIEPAGSSDSQETVAAENNIPKEVQEEDGEITVISENEQSSHVTPQAPVPSRASVNSIAENIEKDAEKLDPVYINALEKRKLKLGEYEFGVDGINKAECRILVPDENDANAFRIFAKHQGKWYCRPCAKKNSRKIRGILKNGCFFVPPLHLCEPITRQEWENQQQYIKDRFSRSHRSSISMSKEENIRQTRRSSAAAADNESVTTSINGSSTSRPSTSLSTEVLREVDTCDAEYGFNENGKLKGRLIVREAENRKYAREYTVTEADEHWKCLNCDIGYAKKNDINFLVTTKHECEPILYSKIQENEVIYRAKYKQLTENKHPPPSSNSSSKNHSRSESQMSKASTNLSGIQKSNINTSSSSTTSATSTKFSSSSPILHEIPSSQWEWGRDSTGIEKMRIIVYDQKDKRLVHEYRITGKKLYCLGCHTKSATYTYASRSDDEKNPIISIPPSERHVCKPRSLEEVREQQKSYETNRRKRVRNEVENYVSENEEHWEIKRTRKSAQIATERLTSCYKDWENVPAKDLSEIEIEEFENEKRIRRYATVPERDTETTTSPFDEADNQNIFNHDFDSPEPLPSMFEAAPVVQGDEPLKKDHDEKVSLPTIKQFASSDFSKPFKFYYPSSADIEKCCSKLNLPYSNLANMFWGQINIPRINPTSIPNKLNTIFNEERSGFACLSLFLTGVETNALAIKDTFNKIYFSQNLSKMGKYYGEDFSLIYDVKTIQILFSDVLTKYHLQALCHFFECRIGIFGEGKWEKYGSWNDISANILTFLMKKDGEKFCPVLSLMQ